MEKALVQFDAAALVTSMKSCLDESPVQYDLLTLKDVLQKSINIVIQLINDERLKDLSGGGSAGMQYLVLDNAQFFEPRGRHNISIGGDGFEIVGKNISLRSLWNNIDNISFIPSSSSSKKEGEDLLALSLKTPLKNGNKDMKNILIVLSRSKSLDVQQPYPISGTEARVVSVLLEHLWKHKLTIPNPSVFQSANANSFFRCYKGVQEGVLYLLSKGILFVKPMLFLSVDAIESVVAGRGGSAVTRYIDLIVATNEGTNIEFTNIEREELPGIQ
eukprot:gene13551-28745_t